MHVPFNKPNKSYHSMAYIEEVIRSGKTGGDGVYTKSCSTYLSKVLGSRQVLMTTSCTHALELALALMNLKPGDEVIMPSYTFPSTANSVLVHCGKVVFTEVEEDTLCMDWRRLEEKITPRTKAIMVVHYGGHACDMDPIMAIASRYGLYVIEDAAQGLFSTYKGQSLGTIGHFGAFSFHETKNISAGEGGALLINTLDSDRIKRAHYIRQKGTNRLDYTLGEVDYYQWVDKGSSYCPSELQMAYLYGQLEASSDIQEKRGQLYDFYKRLMDRLNTPYITTYSKGNRWGESNGHIFYLVFQEPETASAFRRFMKEEGVAVYTHFVPLHISKMGEKLGYKPEDFPYEMGLHDRLVRLPLYSEMTVEERDYIEEAMRRVFSLLGKESCYDDYRSRSCL